MLHRVHILRLLPACLLPLWIGSLAACSSSGPQAPADWIDRQSAAVDAAAFDEPQPALQVLICQGQVHGTHTGLRILQADEAAVFWDPAGQYGINRSEVRRSRDVIVEGAPSVADYVRWRLEGAEDSAVALYEWQLPAQRAAELAAILTHEASVPDGEEEFETTTIGLFCCQAVCRFLDRYARDEMSIPEFWFRPEHLGKHLWSQHPDRVGIFHEDGRIEVFVSPTR